MSDLQLALIAAGVVLVVAVVAYNKWQEARFRRRAEAALQPVSTDVLLRSGAERRIESEPEPVKRVEPVLSAAESPPVVEESVDSASTPGVLDPGIDYIVAFESLSDVQGSAVLSAAMKSLGTFRRSVNLEGTGPDGWERLQRNRRYQRLRCGLQVIDRRGTVNAEELARFDEAVQAIAASCECRVESGNLRESLGFARQLDQLCEQVDIQIVFHVVSREGLIPGTRIRALAESAGMQLEDDGCFRLRDEEGREVFSLRNEEATAFAGDSMKAISTASVSLELDVPRSGDEAFQRLREFADQFAGGAGGLLVDDNRAPLSPAGLDAIARQLAPVYETMRGAGVPAGSPLARRLFS